MKEASADLLSRPGFAGDQKGLVQIRNSPQRCLDLTHLPRYAQDTLFPRWRLALDQRLRPFNEDVHLKWFGNIVPCACPHEGDGLINISIAGNE